MQRQYPTSAATTAWLCVALSLPLLVLDAHAQDLSGYRTFELGSSVAAVSASAEIPAARVRTIHARPSVLQDLEWRPARWVSSSSTVSTDPVEQIVFSFYDDQLHRIVIDYANERTEGMTDADMIDALSATYGTPAARPAARSGRPETRMEQESGSVVAQWAGTEQAVVLYRTSTYRPAFRLVVTEPRLQDLAVKAEGRAVRLDEQEAPVRRMARDKKERDDALAAAEKARTTNKRLFIP